MPSHKLTDVLNSYEKISLLTGLLLTLIILLFYYLMASAHVKKTKMIDVTQLPTPTTIIPTIEPMPHANLENDVPTAPKLHAIKQKVIALRNDVMPYNDFPSTPSNDRLAQYSPSQSMSRISLPNQRLPLVMTNIPDTPTKIKTASDKLKTDDRIRRQSAKQMQTAPQKQRQVTTKPESRVQEKRAATKAATPSPQMAHQKPDSRKEQQAFLVLEQSLESLHPH